MAFRHMGCVVIWIRRLLSLKRDTYSAFRQSKGHETMTRMKTLGLVVVVALIMALVAVSSVAACIGTGGTCP